MTELSIDIETFSSVPLGGQKSQGVYKYVEAEDFDILMITYGFGDEELVTIDLASGEKLPQRFIAALTDTAYLKTAWNAAFEIQCLREYLRIDLDPSQWCCTMIKAGMLGLPMKLDHVGMALKLDVLKDKLGSLCIKTFSEPCKPTIKNGMKTRLMPADNPELWQAYLSYNRTDVAVEKAVRAKISFFTVPPMERRLWVHDRMLNDIGIRLDIWFIKKAIEMRDIYQGRLRTETILMTNVENPGSNIQILNWINERCGTTFTSLNKTEIPKILEAVDDEIVLKVLENRAQYSKSSLSKFDKMLDIVCKDGRVHGIIQLYGANRTGRYAGRFIQPQNFTKNNNIKDIEFAKSNVINLSADDFYFMYGDVLGALSELVRPALIPTEGHVFEVSDLAGIEARVVAWLSGEQWVLDAVAAGKDLYIVTAAMMFKIDEFEVDDDGRQKGKICVLSLGYQGAVGAMMTMGAVRMGLCEEAIAVAKDECKRGVTIKVKNKKREDVEVLKYPKWDDDALSKACAPVLLPLIRDFRAANPNTVAYWKLCENAVKDCIRTRQRQELTQGMYCYYAKGLLFIHLPSGRELAYYHPRLEVVRKVELNEAGEEVVSYKETITYMGIDQEKKIWKKIYTYGGKICENLSQAVSRDVMCTQMLRMWDAGHKTVLHVHDEVVNEKPTGQSDISKVNEILAMPIDWAPGLPLAAKGFVSTHYKKD